MTAGRRIIAFLLYFCVGCSAMAAKNVFEATEEVKGTWTTIERSTLNQAHVSWMNASAPFNRYLLIKDGEFLCAVRFVNFLRGRDARSPSFWSSGEETLTAAYEWDVLAPKGDGVGAAESGKDTVKFSAPTGLGHLVMGGGYENVRCGSRKFGWQYPNSINFSQAPGSEMRLAPTGWDRVDQIKINAPTLVWYSFDTKRKPSAIPADDLPR
jgi:hypothetical protein